MTIGVRYQVANGLDFIDGSVAMTGGIQNGGRIFGSDADL
jgi:hypothetical protein